MTWKDLLEILIVAYLIYRVLIMYTGTRAFQILVGFVLIMAVYVLAEFLELGLISSILSQVFTYGAFALIVVFQPELRSALAQLGRSRVWRMFAKLEEREVVDEVVRAAERLARAKIGGIIAIQREMDLGDFVDRGTPVGADLSAELLTTIFTPYSPLHDGAVIVKGDRIAAAGSVILRLSESVLADRSLGTRHRAALGLSEETDALVVVVSEETGQISLAHRGQLSRGLRPEDLRARLEAGGEEAEEEAEPESDEAEPGRRGSSGREGERRPAAALGGTASTAGAAGGERRQSLATEGGAGSRSGG